MICINTVRSRWHLEKVCRFGLVFLLAVLLSQNLLAYPSSLKFDIALTSTPDQLMLSADDRFLFSRSQTAGLVRVVDLLGFDLLTTISPGGSPAGSCLLADDQTLVVTLSGEDIVSVDISDPFDIAEAETLEIASNLKLTTVRCATVSGKEYLYLWDSESNSLIVYNFSDQGFAIGDQSSSTLSLADNVVDFRAIEDLGVIVIIKSTGLIEVYDLSSLALYSSLDLSSFFSTEMALIGGLVTSVSGYGYLGLFVNNSDPGEVYLVDFNDILLSGIFAIDADSTDGDLDPLEISANPTALTTGLVNNAADEATGQANYAVFVNSSGTLDWVDLGDLLTESSIEVFTTSETSASAPLDGLLFSSADDGYLYLADKTATRLRVFSENPLLTIISSPSPAVISSGTSSSFSFSSDSDGSYNVQLNGYQEKDSGLATDKGSTVVSDLLTADQQITVTVDDSYSLIEGTNYLTLFVNNGGLVGREQVNFIYDLPPPVVSNFKVEFGNEKIEVSFKSLKEDDIDYYNLYFGIAADNLNGLGALTSPIVIDHPGSSKKIRYRLEPITNGTEVFVQVAAVDANGNIGERTAIKSNTTEETLGIIAQLSETGGCGTIDHSFALLGLCCFFLLVFRFKWRRKLLFFLLLFSFLATSNLADAKDEERSWFAVDAFYNFYLPADQLLNDYYGALGNDLFSLRFAVSPWNHLFLGVEAGFLFERSRARGITSGRPSVEKIKFTYIPINYELQYRLNFLPVKFLTPVLATAFAMNYYDITEESGSISGLKFSIKPSAALLLRLDYWAREIWQSNDILGFDSLYLHLRSAYNHQLSSGLDLSSWEFAAGLGFEL